MVGSVEAYEVKRGFATLFMTEPSVGHSQRRRRWWQSARRPVSMDARFKRDE